MALDTWLLFFITSIGISLTPGPNGLLALTHGALHGGRKTLFTIAGGLIGFVLLIALCMFGIGALVQASITWLVVLKWVGGLYLAWLGIKLWRSPPVAVDIGGEGTTASGHQLFRQGFLTAATNPKCLLFFSALLPQFIDVHRSLAVQFAVVAITYTVTEFVTECAIASAAARVRPWLARVGRRFNQACGGIFVAIGLALPLRSA
ncbi:putative transporter, LysE family [Bradyrhizobium oligotrophicum S58]|uniref:Putative transporter, LysE family n=1 Tax=Bradyrhizobium oligotrophicum S58 TaxID=1245469 RepID=M4Z866_9BRAD|nr:LysE family transporter [Bradyrhizobium oligotrophicum]BAM89803.1 putative transporter, LysE family [Bradyrhizobium oligotrophicum S58]